MLRSVPCQKSSSHSWQTIFFLEKSHQWTYLFFLPRFFVGNFFRLVLANSRNCFSLIDRAICLDAPFSDDFDRFPRLAARAAPAAICCFFDLAGIHCVRGCLPCRPVKSAHANGNRLPRRTSGECLGPRYNFSRELSRFGTSKGPSLINFSSRRREAQRNHWELRT